MVVPRPVLALPVVLLLACNSPPELSRGTVTPDEGTPATEFTYSVDYRDEDGDEPATHVVDVDGTPHEMELVEGEAHDGTYAHTTRIPAGLTHRYQFVFSDGRAEIRHPGPDTRRMGPRVIARLPGQLDTPSREEAWGLAVDDGSNVYLAGFTAGSLEGENRGGTDLFLARYGPGTDLDWMVQTGTSEDDAAESLATDGTDLYVAGRTGGALAGRHRGGQDATLLKYDGAGDRVWGRQLGTPEEERALAVATGADGGVYVAGFTHGSLAEPGEGGADLFVARYSADGERGWIRQTGTPELDLATALATGAAGDLYVLAYTEGNLGGDAHGGVDIVLLKYDRDGVLQWTRRTGTPDDDVGNGIATGPGGDVHVAAQTVGGLEAASAGGVDAALLKYDPGGNHVWTRQIGTSRNDLWNHVSVDERGNVYVAGMTDGPLRGPNQGGADAVLAKFDPEGEQLWLRQLGTGNDDFVTKVFAASPDRVYITGMTGDFGADTDVYHARYDGSGGQP